MTVLVAGPDRTAAATGDDALLDGRAGRADGVLDPVKVTRSALRNAESIASMVLTTDTLVVEKKEEEPPAAGGHGHGHGH